MCRADSERQLEEMRGQEHAGVMCVRGEATIAALVCLVRLASPDLFEWSKLNIGFLSKPLDESASCLCPNLVCGPWSHEPR